MKNNNIIRIRAQIKLGSFLLGSENLNFNTKERRKSIKVIVSDEERSLIEAKANFYGYKTIESYIRDTAIYEKVTHVDLKSKNELYEAYSNNTKELKKIAKEFRHFSKYATQISQEDMKNISITMFTILKKQKQMLQLIENKLDIDIWQEINKKDHIDCQ